jgi:phage internal scaffolding protein
MKSVTPFIRNPYNYDLDVMSMVTGLECLEPTMTQQQFKDECDINVLAERFGLTGVMPLNPNTPSYGDFGEVFDFQTAMNSIVATKANFMQLTASVRKRFSNDPQELLVFMENPANRQEAISLGLIPPPPVPPHHPAPSAAPAASTPSP